LGVTDRFNQIFSVTNPKAALVLYRDRMRPLLQENELFRWTDAESARIESKGKRSTSPLLTQPRPMM
jgi:hypothetical protein